MGTAIALMLPFLGTAAGAACVFFIKKQISMNLQRVFTGFAAGVMVAASVWSLLIPAMDMSESMGKFAFFLALVGFLLGIVFLLFMDNLIPHLHVGSDHPEGQKSNLGRSAMMFLAVTSAFSWFSSDGRSSSISSRHTNAFSQSVSISSLFR